MTPGALPEAMPSHLFITWGSDVPSDLPEHVTASLLPSRPADAAVAVAERFADPRVESIVCWDPRVGRVPWARLDAFGKSTDDAWHPGAALSGTDAGDPMRFVLPVWVYRLTPEPDQQGAVNWRIDHRACFLRASAVRSLGGLDGTHDTLAGVMRELGLRLLRRGGIVRQWPDLVSCGPLPTSVSAADRYRLVGQILSWKWQAYALVRQVMEGHSLVEELRAWRAASNRGALPRAPEGALARDLEAVSFDERARVTVVLPTFGRYKYLAEVLEDLRAQTVQPKQILIADGNPPEARADAPYEGFADLPIEVIWHEEGGTCASRNACIERAIGDYIWFVDDDSRFDARNLELHLRALAAYGADVSVGPAYTRERPDLHPEQREFVCSFMDCGTTLCRREILESAGGFDMRFNQYLAGEDGELGIRFVRAGGVMINNPAARRFHYLAPIGGARRSKNNVHRWTRWSLLPRPVQSIYYTARRHFEPESATEAVIQAGLIAGWRRKEGVPATTRWKTETALAELAALPLTAYRMWRSARIGRDMVRTGPGIPPVRRDRPGQG